MRPSPDCMPAALLALLLAGCTVPALAPRPDGAHSLELIGGSRLLVAARINGRPVRALLDSAAEATLLDREFARSLGLAAGTAVTARGSGAAEVDATLVSGVTLEAAGLTLLGQTVAIVDLADVGHRLLGGRVDAILGRELFDAARLRIDIGHGTIEAVDRAAAPPGERCALETRNGIGTFLVRVEDGAPVRATFDLGNGSKVLIGEAYARRAGLLAARAVTTERGGGLGGETTLEVITLTSLELAGRRFGNVPATIDRQPTATDVNVGTSLLRHFLITTDFAAHALWLAPID